MTVTLARIRLAEVLHVARLRNASDVHLCAGAQPVLRVDGKLEPQPTVVPSEEEIDLITRELLCERARAQLSQSGDVTVSYCDGGVGVIRAHAYRTGLGIALALRLLATSIPSLDSLQLPATVASFTERSHGLVIIAGPTGSGKSTLLAALIDRINRASARHIVTIEDPIEYVHRSDRSMVSQREVGRDVPTFVEALYGALRVDPDVILVGEMREPSTMHAALTAAETGHLVFATLHTGDAPQTVERIIGAFGGEMQELVRIQLAQALIGVVCMRLLPHASGLGRRCATEVLVASDAVRTLIRDGKTHQIRNIISTSRHSGMQTLEAHLSDLIARREITLESAKVVTERPEELRSSDRVAL